MSSIITSKGRNFNVDLIRLFALFTVCGVHFFYNTTFYNNTVTGPAMVVSVFLRQFFMICVPLFIILTGYLHCGKDIEFNGKWIKKLLKILIPYGIITVLVWIFGITFRMHPYINKDFFGALFGFENNGYGWYVEFYLGLFLLVPFLNKIWNGLDGKIQRQNLIGVLGILTFIPAFVNAFEISIPDYWVSALYPITYYYIGCYIKEYGLSIGKVGSILMITTCVGLAGATALLMTKDGVFQETTGTFYCSLFTAGIAVGVFNLFVQKKTENVGDKIKASVSKWADSVFTAYLFSVISDLCIYYIFNPFQESEYGKKLAFGMVYVIISFGFSLLAGRAITAISNKMLSVFEKSRKKNDV